jgi:hypothetical protein
MTGVVSVVPAYRAIQYLGTNSADIDAAINDFSVDSETDGVLYSTSGGVEWEINTSDWVVFYQGTVSQVLNPAQLAYFYDVNAMLSDLTGTPGGVASTGIGTAPTVPAGGDVTVSVPMIPAMPSTAATVNAVIFGGTIADILTVTSATATSTTNVDVVIHNPGSFPISGAQVLVDAS